MKFLAYPSLINGVMSKGHSAAFALWHMARLVDEPGSGQIEMSSLMEFALRLWSTDKFYRAVRDATRIGLIEVVTRRRDRAKCVRAVSLEKAARAGSVHDLGEHGVWIEVDSMRTAKSFRAALFSAFHAGRGNSDNPISRKKLREATSVPERTQRRYERIDGTVNVTRNCALTDIPPEGLEYAQDTIHPGCYVKDGQVVRPLPNSYTATQTTHRSSTLRKVNHVLSGGVLPKTGLISKSSGAQRRKTRLFFGDEKAVLAVARREAKIESSGGIRSPLVKERYCRAGKGKWRVA